VELGSYQASDKGTVQSHKDRDSLTDDL